MTDSKATEKPCHEKPKREGKQREKEKERENPRASGMLILMYLGDRGSLGQDQCRRRNREGARHGRWLGSEARRASALEELSEVIRHMCVVDPIQQGALKIVTL